MITITSREQAYLALFNHIQQAPSMSGLVKTFTRRLKHWADVGPEDQPALYMEQTGEQAVPASRQPTKNVLEINLWLYLQTNEGEVGPIINPLLDGIEKSLTPSNDGNYTQTLGGLVHHCWIEGQTQIFEGDLGAEAVAIVPVKILVT
jgi:hypothetical protein